MIKVSNLNKYYNKGKSNEIHVINNTNLVLPNSGFIVFLGASGSGKTTLINVIAGLDKAKGEISYDEATFKNYKMNKIDRFRRDNIGYVFQNYNLLPNVTVFDNLRIALELMGITDKDEVKERIDYVLDMLKMKKFKNKLASNLSGGQMQRVSIARALVKDSKIIIADEPTGNLDSENTIEVMNILKAISKTRLVIMVTHDKKSASFYADRIVEIKDGIVEKDYENDSNGDLDNYDKSKIYLKDLKNEVLEIGNFKLNLFVEENESLNDINLTIVKKDGNIYLKSDDIKYLDNDSKIQLIDDNYRAIKKEDISNFEFNPKPFEKQKKKFSLMPLLYSIRDAYRTHRASSKKMKGLHACFIIIGVVMAVCVLMLSVGTYVNSDQVDYCDTGVVFKRGDIANYSKELEKMIDEGLIVDYSRETSLTYKSKSNRFVSLGVRSYELNYNYINDSLVEGKKTIDNDNEIIITKRIADTIIKRMGNIEKITYKSLIGDEIYDKKIVGIVNSTSTTIYTNETGHKVRKSYPYIQKNEYALEYYEYVENEYTLISGTELQNDDECLIDDNLYMKEVGGATTLTVGDKELKIVGVFTYKDLNNNISLPPVLVKDKSLAKANYKNYNYFGLVPASKLKLVEGNMPVGKKEIIVSKYYEVGLNAEVDQMINDNKFEIVGYFESDNTSILTAIGMDDKAILYNDTKYPSNEILITTNDSEVINRFKNAELTFKTSYNLEHDLLVKQKQEMFGSTITVSLVFLIITVIYTFFMMRSKMIHRIYEVGVLREIGASKYRIYRIFFAELLVLVFMTTMIGYVGSLILCHFANLKIHGLLNVFRYSPLYAFLGFVVLLAVSFISGMLPVFTLQRKTPAEIVSKYDL